jgi:hypothetical protein
MTDHENSEPERGWALAGPWFENCQERADSAMRLSSGGADAVEDGWDDRIDEPRWDTEPLSCGAEQVGEDEFYAGADEHARQVRVQRVRPGGRADRATLSGRAFSWWSATSATRSR